MKFWIKPNKQKLKKILIRISVWIAALVLLYLFLTSSFMICNCYLPLISKHLDADISARSVKFYLFRERNIQIKDLNIRLQNHLSCKVVRLNATIDLGALFSGTIKLDQVSAKKSELILGDFPDSEEKQWTDRLTRDRFQLGDAEVDNFTIRHIPKNSDRFWRIHFDHISCKNLISESPGTIHFKSHLAWNLPDTSVLDFPLTGTLEYELSDHLFPTNFSGTIDTESPTGSMLEHDLNDLKLHAAFSGEYNKDRDLLHLKSFLVEQRSNEMTPLQLSGSGEFNTASENGSLDIQFSAKNSDLQLLKLYYTNVLLPERADIEVSAKLTLEEKLIACKAQLSGKTAELRDQNQLLLKDVVCDITWEADFQKENRTFYLRNLNAEITHEKGKQLLSLQTGGLFSLKGNEDGTWDIETDDANLKAKVSAFPLNILNPFVPVKIKSGTLDGEYILNGNDTEQRITGKMDGHVQNLTLQHEFFSITSPFRIQWSAGLQTEGLTNISAVEIKDLNMSVFTDKKQHGRLELSGKYLLTEKIFDLQGKFRVSPVALLKKLKFPLSKTLQENMTMDAADKLWTGETNIRADLHTNTVVLKGSSYLATEIISHIKVPNKYIRIGFDTVLAITADSMTARINDMTLDLPERINANFSGLLQLPETVLDLNVKIHEIYPQTFRELREIFEYKKNFYARLFEDLKYDVLSGKTMVRWDNVNNILYANEADVVFHFEDNKQGMITLGYPLIVDLNTKKFASTDIIIQMNNLPFRVANFFFGEKSRHSVEDSLVNGKVSFTIENDVSRAPVSGDFTVDRVKFSINGLKFDFGRTRIHGHGFFFDHFKGLKYEKAQAQVCRIGDTKNEPVLTIDMHGQMLLRQPLTAKHYFQYRGLDEHIFKHMIPGFTERIAPEKLESDGSLVILTENSNAQAAIRYEQNIRIAKLPLGSVNGKIHFDSLLRKTDAPEILLRSSNLSIYTEDKREIFDLSLTGKWKKTKDVHTTKCTAMSDVADWKTLHSYFVKLDQPKPENANDQKEKLTDKIAAKLEKKPEKQVAKKTKKQDNKPAENKPDIKTAASSRWISQEPGGINFSGFATEMDVHLKNWTYGAIEFQADGILSVQNNQFKTVDFNASFNDDAKFKMSVFADLGQQDGWVLSCNFDATDLDIAPFATELISDKEKGSKFSGHVNTLKFRSKTKGITQANLDKNLDLALFAELDQFSFPIMQDDNVDAIKLLMLPFTLLPQLLDQLPGAGSRFIQKLIVGDLLMALSGKKNLEINKAQVYVRSAEKGPRSDLEFKKCLFVGNSYGFAAQTMKLSPFTKKITVDSMLSAGTFKCPLVISGTLDQPEMDHKVLKTISESLSSAFSFRQNELWKFMPHPEL